MLGVGQGLKTMNVTLYLYKLVQDHRIQNKERRRKRYNKQNISATVKLMHQITNKSVANVVELAQVSTLI